MRIIGVIFVVAGILLAIGLPWFQSNLTGEEVTIATLYDRDNGWRLSEVHLDPDDNPHRVRINIFRLRTEIRDNSIFPVIFRMASKTDGQKKIEETLNIDLRNSATGIMPEGAPKLISQSTPAFNIEEQGDYKFGAIPLAPGKANPLRIDRDIVRINARVFKKVQATSTSYRNYGICSVIFGIIILSFFGRSSKARHQPSGAPGTQNGAEIEAGTKPKVARDSKDVGIENKSKKSKTSVGKTIRWGRDAGKRRD